MVGIVTDQTRKKILQRDKQKLQQELNQKQQELGLRGIVPLKKQDELRQLQDLQNNSNKILDQMEQAKQQRYQRQRDKKIQERKRIHRQAPKVYQKQLKRLQKEQFQKRRIKL